jgi:hypothetical protein
VKTEAVGRIRNSVDVIDHHLLGTADSQIVHVTQRELGLKGEEERVDSETEQQRAQRIALLCAFARRNLIVAEPQDRRVFI